jgi:hypothetical protein
MLPVNHDHSERSDKLNSMLLDAVEFVPLMLSTLISPPVKLTAGSFRYSTSRGSFAMLQRCCGVILKVEEVAESKWYLLEPHLYITHDKAE